MKNFDIEFNKLYASVVINKIRFSNVYFIKKETFIEIYNSNNNFIGLINDDDVEIIHY